MNDNSQKNKRHYYSQRTGKRDVEMDLNALKKIFADLFEDYVQAQYFDEYFGKECPDNAAPGKISNPESYILRRIRKKNLWPIAEKYEKYSEEDLFDMIEFLYDHISRPLEEGADFHSYCNCGYHYINFDQKTAQTEYMEAINEFLNDYGEGYELNDNGEIYALLQEEFRPLLTALISSDDPENIDQKVRIAIDKYRRYGSTLNERRDAVRDLADCLEYMRSDVQKALTKQDEKDLFNIVNNFGIRHHNDRQKTNYNRAIWLSWMFYYYLATIHVVTRLIIKN